MNRGITSYFQKTTDASPLAVFRIGFGVMMLASMIRFWYHGWIETLYIEPNFHFSYYGFEWIKPLGSYTYLLFVLCGLSALCIALGFKYRLAIITFFLSFTYMELIDKTTYLNHYYFISIGSFLLIFLPANASFSIDNLISKKRYAEVPKWTIDSLKLLLALVYVYAGLAKLNSDWMFNAMPLKIWLPTKYDIPLLGETIMHKDWFHYAMSWCGILYDLTIPFLLLYKPTRWFAYALVIIFHVFTRVLFNIGMFPYIMIVATLIFFDSSFHNQVINSIKIILGRLWRSSKITVTTIKEFKFPSTRRKIVLSIVGLFFVVQILMPWRYLLYPGELFWTEEGYRFSWRVMLMEKAGYANFKIVDGKTEHFFYVDNADFLTSFQEKQMSFQPDFILEYAHYLGDHFKSQGHKNIEVYVDCHVALNGRLSTRYIDPEVDLYDQQESFKHKTWILPFNDEIKGL